MWKSSGKWKDLAAKAVQSKDKTQEASKSRTRVQRNISIQNLQVSWNREIGPKLWHDWGKIQGLCMANKI